VRPQKKKSKAAIMTAEQPAIAIPAMAPVESPFLSSLVSSLGPDVVDCGVYGGNGSPGLSM
jgi:hypothetical protein